MLLKKRVTKGNAKPNLPYQVEIKNLNKVII